MSLCSGVGSPVLRGHDPVGRQAFSPGVLFSLVKATKCFLCATPEIKNRFLVIFVQAFKGKWFFKRESISYAQIWQGGSNPNPFQFLHSAMLSSTGLYFQCFLCLQKVPFNHTRALVYSDKEFMIILL